MNKIITYGFLLITILSFNSAYGQNWTWLHGANVIDDLSNYGTMGVEAPTNKPGSRREFVTWKDANGTLWMFGGYGRTVSTTLGHLSDLWRFNPVNNQWTWVNGPNTRNALGIYGTLQTSASTNRPGGRRGATGWADNAGNLWLFSGFGYGSGAGTGRLNDLWKYNTTTNEWTWMSGANTTNQLGDYTTAGSLRPGGRSKAMSWTNGTDGWIFAGEGYTSTVLGQLNDLWKFNSTNNTWTFLKGDNGVTVAGVYGTVGTSDPLNKPGARENGATWYDAGNLYLFGGGIGLAQIFADLWKFNIASGDWTWVKGPSTFNATGVYGNLLTTDPANYPGSREFNSAFKDAQGRVFVVAGYGYSSSGSGNLNDVWCYKAIDNTWTWVRGSNMNDALANYGTINVNNSTNEIGARYGTAGWMNASGNIILFGGFGNGTTATTGYMNDVWTFGSSTVLPITLKDFSANKQNDQINISWTTSSEINNEHFEILHSTDGAHFDVLGKINSRGNSSEEQTYQFAHLHPNLAVTNYYQLKQIDIDGKSSMSEIIKVENQVATTLEFTTYVNAYQQLVINANTVGYSVKLYDMNGQCVRSIPQQTQASIQVDISGLMSGIYVVQVLNKNQVKSERVSVK
jgi:N-acetylneuraminic acid mutarotase